MPLIDLNNVNNQTFQNPNQVINNPVPGSNVSQNSQPIPVQINGNNPVQQVTLPQDISSSLDQKLQNLTNTIANQPQNVPSTNLSPLSLKKYTLQEILNEAIRLNASDVHLTVGYRAYVRVDGELKELGTAVIDQEQMQGYVGEIVKTRKDINVNDLHEDDLSYSFSDRRFRVNIFKEMGGHAVVMRLVPKDIKTIDELGIPQIFKEFAKVPAGLILVTGPTGSGKSTTLASILNHINITQKKHIVTLEDPIEFVYPKNNSIIEQREFGIDFDSWTNALKSLLRQDPNVVLVGEMRDYETIASTITVSETGHLVFATLHTNSAAQSIDRIIDVFPEVQQGQIRAQLANVLTAIVSQRLVKLNNGGRKAVMEIMVANPAIKNSIREGKTHQIDNMIQTGQDFGMISMEKSLVELVRKGEISVDAAMQTTIKPKELEILLNK